MPHKKQKKDRKKKKNSIQPKDEEKEIVTVETTTVENNRIENNPIQNNNTTGTTPIETTNIEEEKIIEINTVETNRDETINIEETKEPENDDNKNNDNNDDGMNEVIKAFEYFDLNHDGKINISDLTKILSTFGNTMSEEEMNKIFKSAGIIMDDNKEIDYSRFIEFWLGAN